MPQCEIGGEGCYYQGSADGVSLLARLAEVMKRLRTECFVLAPPYLYRQPTRELLSSKAHTKMGHSAGSSLCEPHF